MSRDRSGGGGGAIVRRELGQGNDASLDGGRGGSGSSRLDLAAAAAAAAIAATAVTAATAAATAFCCCQMAPVLDRGTGERFQGQRWGRRSSSSSSSNISRCRSSSYS